MLPDEFSPVAAGHLHWIRYFVAGCVDIGLVNVHAISHIQSLKMHLCSSIFVVEVECFLAHLDEIVLALTVLVVGQVEALQMPTIVEFLAFKEPPVCHFFDHVYLWHIGVCALVRHHDG